MISDMSRDMIEDLKKQLDYILGSGRNISVYYEPKIEEIYSTIGKTVAKAVLEIRIEYNDTKYIKDNNDIFANWENYRDYMLKRSDKSE